VGVLLQALEDEHPAEARVALEVLASRLRDGHQDWSVEVAGADDPALTRAQPLIEPAFVDVFNLVLDDDERHLLDTARIVILTWANTREYFRIHEMPVVVVWINGAIVHLIMLPEARHDGAR
jgi:hypothetical protein